MVMFMVYNRMVNYYFEEYFMILQKTYLGDGLSLSSINTDKFKSGVLSLSLCLPLCRRDYLLGLVLSGIMRRGTQKYPSMAKINRRLDMLYATTVDVNTSIRGNVHCFNISADMLEPRFSLDGTDISEEVIATLAEILLHPLMSDGVFSEELVSAEKQIIFDALCAESNETSSYASARLKELLNRDNETFPTLEYLLSEIKSVSARELSGFHARLCAAPMRVIYVGGEKTEKIAASLERHFGSFFKNQLICFSAPTPQAPLPLCEVSEDRAVNQGKLSMGFRTGVGINDKRGVAAAMLNEIFGASPSSKLFLVVREQLGLCYYCHSSFGAMTGNISVHSGIDVKNRDIAFFAIQSVLEAIRKGNISDFEMSAAKKSLSHSYTQLYDSPYALISFYFVRDLFGISESVESRREAILGVTAQQIAELAADTKYDTRFFLNGTIAEGTEDNYD